MLSLIVRSDQRRRNSVDMHAEWQHQWLERHVPSRWLFLSHTHTHARTHTHTHTHLSIQLSDSLCCGREALQLWLPPPTLPLYITKRTGALKVRKSCLEDVLWKGQERSSTCWRNQVLQQILIILSTFTLHVPNPLSYCCFFLIIKIID